MTLSLPGNQSEDQVIVASLLKAPTVIAGRVLPANTDFLSTYLFGVGVPTPSGQVQYQVTKLDNIYPTKGNSKIIEPGSRFPRIDAEQEPSTDGHTDKFGAEYIVTYEAVERNNVLPMRRGNELLRNTITRQDATRCFAAIEAAVAEHNQAVTSTDVWSTEGVAWTTLGTALASAPTGVNFNTLLLNKQDAWTLAQAKDLRDAYKPTNRADAVIYNTVFSPLSGLMGLDVVINDFVPAGTAYLIEREAAGFVALEKDFAIRVVDEPKIESYTVMGSKRSAPFVDNPGAVQVINGIS